MPIEAIDAQIQGLISDAQLKYSSDQVRDASSTDAQKEVEKKAAAKKDLVKQTLVDRETFQKNEGVNAKLAQILGGAMGSDAASALNGWNNNAQLQSKLTEAQKNMFREAIAANPAKGTEAAQAMNRVAQTPQFEKAVQTPAQAGTISGALLDNPKTEKLISDVLNTRFMQSVKADDKAKTDFMRFAFARGADSAKQESIKKAGDMLGSLTGQGVTSSGQRAAVNMVIRRPGDTKAMASVDAFVQQPQIGKLPTFARSKSTELLAKANGGEPVKEGFEELAQNPTFKSQTATNKGRFFATIGSGKPSEYRQLTDSMLTALQSGSFPTREGQVSKFLAKMSEQTASTGAGGVDTGQLVKQAKTSALPKSPKMLSTEGLSEEDALKVRSQNRAKVIQYYTQLGRVYDQAEKKLNGAKYFEDVNSLQTLRKAEDVDTSQLSPEDAKLVQAKSAEVNEKLGELQKLQRQKARELRTKRMPPAKRRAAVSERQAIGRKPKYFNPAAAGGPGRKTPTQVFAKAASAQTSIGGDAGGGDLNIQRQIAAALSSVNLTQDNVGAVAQAVGQAVARSVVDKISRQVAQEVARQFINRGTASVSADTEVTATTQPQAMGEEPSQTNGTKSAVKKQQQGRVDGWGIPRSFERDLGAADRSAVKPALADLGAPSAQTDTPQLEAYSGKTLVKSNTSINTLDTLMQQSWKSMTRAETALLKNLGWNQQNWDTKDTPAAKWPVAMATAFVNLSPLQREALRKLGMAPHDWDKRVQALAMGKNA